MSNTGIEQTREGGSPIPTANGSVWYQMGVFAGQQASLDIKYFQEQQAQALRGTEEPGSPIAIIGLIASIFSAVATGSLAATGIAGLIMDSKPAKEIFNIEVEVTNLSSSSVVMVNYGGSKFDVAKAMDPLAQGESDSFIVTREGAPPWDAQFSMEFLVSRGVGNPVSGFEAIVVKQAYKRGQLSSGPWIRINTVDGIVSYDNSLSGLMGTYFRAATSKYPNFSFYSQTMTTGSGKLSMVFYDLAPAS